MSAQTFPIVEFVLESQKQALKALAETHQAMLRATKVTLDSVPELPSGWTVPSSKTMIESGYDFAAKVLAEQKAFALELGETIEGAATARKRTAEAGATK